MLRGGATVNTPERLDAVDERLVHYPDADLRDFAATVRAILLICEDADSAQAESLPPSMRDEARGIIFTDSVRKLIAQHFGGDE